MADAERLAVAAAPGRTNREMAAMADRSSKVDMSYIRSWHFAGTYAGIVLQVGALSIAFLWPMAVISYINQDIGPTPNYTNVPVVYTALNSVGLLVCGRLSDIYGRRYFFLGMQLSGIIGSIIAATAKTITTLIVSSLFIGIASTLSVAYMIFMGEIVPVRHRGFWSASILAWICPIQYFAPTLATLCVLHQSWRWIYYIAIILLGCSFVLIFVSYHPPSFGQLHQEFSKRDLVKSLDIGGIFLWAVGAVLFILGMSWGGGLYRWDSAPVISCIVIGAVSFISFFVWEANFPLKAPLVNWSFFVSTPRKYLFPFAVSTIAGMFYYGISLIWPILVQAVYTSDPIQGSWYSTAVYTSIFAGATSGGIFFHLGDHHRLKCIVANAFMVIFTAAACTLNRHHQTTSIVCICLASYATGVLETMMNIWMTAARSVENIGLSLGLLGAFRSLAGALAQAIYVTVLNNKSTVLIPQYVTAAALKAGLPESSLGALFAAISAGTAEAFANVPGITPAIQLDVINALKDAYQKSGSYVYIVATAFAGLGLILCFCMAKDLSEDLTSHIGKSLDNKTAQQDHPSGDKVSSNEGDLEKDGNYRAAAAVEITHCEDLNTDAVQRV
ncbi:uncharacterized protein Z518_03591 [Rhinocladiella mackenziei CBS 650.93]|uniref:Major facilitator superfamily (MFS) profile domain-containing protein n=1 Tax=Rhinocladiella mackenziei CBS 650.93 TaxID=1442369 RepID=A0A0D2IIQ3_9EURO|nr:uncharacterized protein Z518_03591 [Rhinocladiella mackenziei CBS 650.93]KIX05619.1 hypothetical protein Z518_03591 [Rhinocladiella mackenziei CBS 650.93]